MQTTSTNYSELTSSEIEQAVIELLVKHKIQYSINAAGVGLKRDNWVCDGWTIELSNGGKSQYFEFFTGIGHRVVPSLYRFQITREYRGSRMLASKLAEQAKPTRPGITSVLHSLVIDAQAINESFSNWCDNFGYDSDSIKSLNTYNTCCENAKKLQHVIPRNVISELSEIVSNY